VNGRTAAKHGECLTDECLTDYLEGSLDPVIQAAFESHLVVCDKCRASLALFMRVLREDVPREEEATLQKLSTTWSKRGLHPVPAPKVWIPPARRLPYAVAAAAALVFIGVFSWKLTVGPKPSTAEQMTEALVASMRTFEPRMVGQPYMAIQEVTRSAEDPVPDVLAKEMTENSADAYAQGRFFLLRKNYPKAIKYLKNAVADPRGVPADVHNDLGVAYFQSGSEYLTAAEGEFKEALERSPSHLAALFNLSLLYSRQGRSVEANQRKQQYLALDPDSGWAKEIARLDEGKPGQ